MNLYNNTACFLLLVSCLFGQEALADQSYYILDPEESGAQLQSSISSPADFLGFEIGDRAIRHNEAILYFRYLGSNSDRAEFAQYGATSAGRELFRLVISDPDNLQKLPEIKGTLDRISSNAGDSAALIESTPAVAWMGYGIHGDELASSDAAVMLAFRLIAGEEDEIREIRRKLFTYVDPMHNPDGRARALQHVDGFRRSKSSNDPQDIVHNQFWTNGRGNHYFFDLNRDAVFQVQTQSRQRVHAIRDANPQLYVASHETEWSDTYLFAVPAEPLNPFLPNQVHQSWADFSKDHSSAFDEIGANYYTRAWNEVFYPGYYDIWPAYFGAVPILYEQAATSGLSVQIPTDQILTFHTAVANHYRSSMANLITASRNKNTLLTRWAQVRRNASDDNSEVKSWVMLPVNTYKSRETLRILTSLGITVEILSNQITVRALQSYWDEGQQDLELPPGTLKIDLSQSMARLIHNVFDYHVPMTADFLAREKRNLDLGRDTQIYDVTAWSLPLAFNASIYWADSSLRGNWQTATDLTLRPDRREVESPANYGYIYMDESLHATARMLVKGLKIRVGMESFVHAGVSYPAGTFLVRGREQSVDALSALNAEYSAGEINLTSAQSARITAGGPDLGGDDFSLLEHPDIAVLGGTGVSITSFGAIWHLLDETIRVPMTLLNIENLNDFDLSRYSVLLLPEVNGDDHRLLATVKAGSLERWIENGGTLITMGRSSLLLARSGIASMRVRSDAFETHPPLMAGRSAHEMISNDFQGVLNRETQPLQVLPPVISDVARRFVSDDFESFRIAENISSFAEWTVDLALPEEDKFKLASGIKKYLPRGAYLRVELKPGHWLTYGVGDKVPALFRDKDTLLSGIDAELVGRYAGPDELMMSGLVWPEAVGYIAGTSYLTRERKGRGQIITFANDPVFRGYSLGTSRLFLNAVILGGAYN